MAVIHCSFSWLNPLPAGHRCAPHSHPCTEIVFSNQAEGSLRQRGKSYSYTHQSVFIYQPGTRHWISNTRPGTHCCIGVIGCQAEQLPEGVHQAHSRLSYYFHEIIHTLRETLDEESRRTRLDLLSGLVVCDLHSPQSRTPPLSRAEYVRRVIEDHLTQPISLSEVARLTSLNKDYLRQLFRNAFGESITRYIMRRRIELASQLLIHSPAPIKEIAAQTGFSSEYYFSRVFRRFNGQPPSRWLKTHPQKMKPESTR